MFFVATRKNASLKTKVIKSVKRSFVPLWLKTQRLKLWQQYQHYLATERPPRSIHSFCIGLPKTGTHSIADMLDCRSKHEAETNILLYLCQNYANGNMSFEEQIRILQTRDKMLWLEMESNWMLGLVIEALVAAFPKAKYILTVREPLSWLESQINEEVETGKIEPFASAHALMFGGKHPDKYTKYDRILAEYGHYSIAGYLSYWAKQYQRIIDSVPRNQLMIVYTKEITEQAQDICQFVGAKGVNLDLTCSYARKHKSKRLTNLLDPTYLTEQIEFYTAEMWQTLVELKSISSL